MKKKISAALIMVMLAAGVITPDSHAGSKNVTVKLPGFKVTLNGTLIDNRTNLYPLIVYKGITYFPMTYYDCRFLGLESIWDKSAGLSVAKTGAGWGYHKYRADKPNSNDYSAVTAAFPIKINEKDIDNSKEEYPLLLFRNVTYFPLTWRFAVEEFGWEYSFDNTGGLSISSGSAGSGAAAGQLTLPIVTRENGEKGAFTMAGDYFYYEGSNGIIYQASAGSPLNKKKIYQLPKSDYYGPEYVYASLKTENGKALLTYHTGGVTMGSDHLIWLREDGVSEKLDVGYSLLKIYGDYLIRVNQRFPASRNNLQTKKYGEGDYKSAGDPDYVYGVIRTFHNDAGSQSLKPSDDLYLEDDEIYVLGYYGTEDPDSEMGIYKVNILTNATERICKEPASGFKIVDDTIYFTDLNDSLYRVSLTGGRAEKLVEEPVTHYNVLNGKIYYSLKNNNEQLYVYGDEAPVNPDGTLGSLETQDGYMVALFDKESKAQYKMMIFDDSGKVIYKTIEKVLLVRIQNGKVVFVKDN